MDGNRILSRKYGMLKKKLKSFQDIVAIFKINSIDFMFLYVWLLGFI